MEKLQKHELTGSPPKVFIDTQEEINMLELNFSTLQSNYEKLKEKLYKHKQNKMEVDSLTKIRLLLNNFDCLINNVEEVIVSLDQEGTWTLTEEDIDRINCNRETNHLFKTFLPFMLTYKIMKDVESEEEVMENVIENDKLLLKNT